MASEYKNAMFATPKYDVQIVVIDDKAKRASDKYIQPYWRKFEEEELEEAKKKDQRNLAAELKKINQLKGD